MEFGGTDTRNITCGISPLDTVQEVKDKEHPNVLELDGVWWLVRRWPRPSLLLCPLLHSHHLVRPHNTPGGSGPRGGSGGRGGAGGEVYIGIEQVGLLR